MKRWALRIFSVALPVSFIWAGVLYHREAPDFIGSPPALCTPQRSAMDLDQHGWWLDKFAKTYRTRSWWEVGPGLIVLNLFPIHGLTGWDVYNESHDHSSILACGSDDNPKFIEPGSCHCVVGPVSGIHISPGDGDFNFFVTPAGEFQYLTDINRWHWWAPDSTSRDPDRGFAAKLLVEVDDPIRKNFPILSDLRDGDEVRVCGAWVFDRSHPHNEIHPATRLDILSPYTCTSTSATQ